MLGALRRCNYKLRRRLNLIGLLCAGALLLIISKAALADRSIDRAEKYYQLTSIAIGGLRLSNLRVSLVAVSSDTDAGGLEALSILRLSSGRFSYTDTKGNVVISGEIGERTDKAPAAEISAKVRWTPSGTELVEISRLRMRLHHARIEMLLAGSQVAPKANQIIVLSLVQPITSSPAAGTIALSFRAAPLPGVAISFLGTSLRGSFRAVTGVRALLDLGSSKLSLRDAVFAARNLSAKVARPITTLIPGLGIQSGLVTLRKARLSFASSRGHLSGDLAVDRPTLTLTRYPNVEVAAAKTLLADGINGDVDMQGSTSIFSQAGATLAYRVIGMPDEMADQINLSSEFTPEALLPTGSSTVRFVKTSAVARIYYSISQAIDHPEALRVLSINGEDGIVTDVTERVAATNRPSPNLDVLNLLCDVSVDELRGQDAANAMQSLLKLPYKSVHAVSTREYAAVFSRMSPKFSNAFATGIVRVGAFLTDTTTGDTIAPSKRKPRAGSHNLVAEIILGNSMRSPMVRPVPHKRLVVESVQATAARWTDPENRFLTFAVSEKIPLTPQPEVTGIIKTSPTQVDNGFLRGPPGQFGDRRKPPKTHTGVDIVANRTSLDKSVYAVRAVSGGRVAYARWNGECKDPKDAACDPSAKGYGYTVVVDHANGTYTLYAHLATLASAGVVHLGDIVTEGQLLGYMADPAHGEYASGNARDTRDVTPQDRIQVHFEEFEATSGRSSAGKLSDIKNGARILDPTPDLIASRYRMLGEPHGALTHDQFQRLRFIQSSLRARDTSLSAVQGSRGAVSGIEVQRGTALKSAAAAASQRRTTYQAQIESFDRQSVEPATNQQKQIWLQQKALNQGGGGYVGGIGPPGPIPGPIGAGPGGFNASTYCGTSTDGSNVRMCTRIQPPR